jgi:hypothetical protein
MDGTVQRAVTLVFLFCGIPQEKRTANNVVDTHLISEVQNNNILICIGMNKYCIRTQAKVG